MFKQYALACAALLTASAASNAAVLYSNNFEADDTANWTVNKTAGVNASADFFFDYSTVGIPAAPGGTGTRGVRLDANTHNGTTAGAVFGGVSVSPNGQAFTGNYRLTANVWFNFIGPAPTGGSGSTQLGGLGVLTAGTTAQWAGGVQDSVYFAASTDGNSSSDWRAYSPGAGASSYVANAPGVYAAYSVALPDARNNSHPYYAGFGLVTPPVAQATLFPTQTGTTVVGSAGFAWHTMVVEKIGTVVTWTVDNLLIATVDTATLTGIGGNNILLNYYDSNATGSATLAASIQNYGVFDNVVVTEVVPEPAAFGLLAPTALALLSRRRRA